MRGRLGWRTAVATLAALVAVTGCGGSSGGGSSVKDGVLTGIDGLAGAGRLTTTMRLDATPAALQSLARAGGSTLDSHLATAISSADVVIETVRGDGGTSLDLKGVANGATLVELRAVKDGLYVQGDVRGIFTLIGKPNEFANLRAETASMPSFVQAILNGQWVSIPASALSSLASLSGGSTSSSGKGPKLLTDLRRAIERHVTVTEQGTDSRGTHYVLHANTKTLATDLGATVQDALPGGAVLSSRLPTDVKSQDVEFDAWVKGGALSEVSIDLLQFDDASKVPAGTTLPLTVTFDRTGDDITAPADATPVDLTQLGTLFGALTGSS